MTTLDFLTPVTYGDNPDITWQQYALEHVDNYFYIWGKQAVVLNIQEEESIALFEGKATLLGVVFKIVTFCIIIFPLIMFIAKVAFRFNHNFIDRSEEIKNAPLSLFGRASVYLPEEIPIVLKIKCPNPQDRITSTREIRSICEQNGYKNLIVPNAFLHEDLIIENRVSIISGTKEQISLYIEHRDKFTEAIKQFVRLIYQAQIYDVIKMSRDPYESFSKNPPGRYDNVALYLEEEEGKIVLVDLEEWHPEKKQKENFIEKLKAAVCLFPLHFEDILFVAKQIDSDVEIHYKDLEILKDEALKYFDRVYKNHLTFLESKNIKLDNPFQLIEITDSRKEGIKREITQIVSKIDNNCYYKNYLGSNEKEINTALDEFKEIFPEILNLTMQFLIQSLRKKKKPTSQGELPAFRSLLLSDNDQLYMDLEKAVTSKLTMIKVKDDWDKDRFVPQIIQGIFTQLKEGREIAYYKHRLGAGAYAKQCIFF